MYHPTFTLAEFFRGDRRVRDVVAELAEQNADRDAVIARVRDEVLAQVGPPPEPPTINVYAGEIGAAE
jgi:hypothetical protein